MTVFSSGRARAPVQHAARVQVHAKLALFPATARQLANATDTNLLLLIADEILCTGW
jgi:hypothetical protein